MAKFRNPSALPIFRRFILAAAVSTIWVGTAVALDRVTVFAPYYAPTAEIAQVLRGQHDETDVEILQINDCSDLNRAANSIVAQASKYTDLAFFVWAPCQDADIQMSQIIRSYGISVPTVVLGTTHVNFEVRSYDDVFSLSVPTIGSSIRSRIREIAGPDFDANLGFAGSCSSPSFLALEEMGPAWQCIDSATAFGASSGKWVDAIGPTMRAALASHPNFGGDAFQTPFGVLYDPWGKESLNLPVRIMFDVDHPAISDRIFRLYGEHVDLFDLLCPNCGGAKGPYCGEECPNQCDGKCTERGSKKCCRGDGMVVPWSDQ